MWLEGIDLIPDLNASTPNARISVTLLKGKWAKDFKGNMLKLQLGRKERWYLERVKCTMHFPALPTARGGERRCPHFAEESKLGGAGRLAQVSNAGSLPPRRFLFCPLACWNFKLSPWEKTDWHSADTDLVADKISYLSSINNGSVVLCRQHTGQRSRSRPNEGRKVNAYYEKVVATTARVVF